MVKVFYPSGVAAKKGIIISVSLNGAMAIMSNQLKSHIVSGVTIRNPIQIRTKSKKKKKVQVTSVGTV